MGVRNAARESRSPWPSRDPSFLRGQHLLEAHPEEQGKRQRLIGLEVALPKLDVGVPVFAPGPRSDHGIDRVCRKGLSLAEGCTGSERFIGGEVSDCSSLAGCVAHLEPIDSTAAGKCVNAETVLDGVCTGVAPEGIVAIVSIDEVVVPVTKSIVGECPRMDAVSAAAPLDVRVPLVAGIDRVRPGAAEDRVPVLIPANRVSGTMATDRVVTGEPCHHVGSAVARDCVRSSGPGELVRHSLALA